MRNKDLLRNQRKGEDDNVLPFESPAIKPDPTDPEFDWLRALPNEARFCAKKKGFKTAYFDHYGIGCVMPWGVLLACQSDIHPGMDWKWVDSREFSKQNIFIGLIPMMTEEPEKPVEE